MQEAAGATPASTTIFMNEEEFNNRHRIFQLGLEVRDAVMDETDQDRIGQELVKISGVCESCSGTGIDGDPPDAAGVGGGTWACERCKGSGFSKS